MERKSTVLQMAQISVYWSGCTLCTQSMFSSDIQLSSGLKLKSMRFLLQGAPGVADPLPARILPATSSHTPLLKLFLPG